MRSNYDITDNIMEGARVFFLVVLAPLWLPLYVLGVVACSINRWTHRIRRNPSP